MFAATRSRTLIRAAAAFVGEPVPVGARRAALAARIESLVALQPADRRRLLALGTLTLEALPLVRHRRLFSRLDDARATSVLRGLLRAPIAPLRRLHTSLKLLLQFAWYLDPEAQAATDYDGPWLGRVDVAVGPSPRLDGTGRPA